jgi:hypothetical protein
VHLTFPSRFSTQPPPIFGVLTAFSFAFSVSQSRTVRRPRSFIHYKRNIRKIKKFPEKTFKPAFFPSFAPAFALQKENFLKKSPEHGFFFSTNASKLRKIPLKELVVPAFQRRAVVRPRR